MFEMNPTVECVAEVMGTQFVNCTLLMLEEMRRNIRTIRKSVGMFHIDSNSIVEKNVIFFL